MLVVIIGVSQREDDTSTEASDERAATSAAETTRAETEAERTTEQAATTEAPPETSEAPPPSEASMPGLNEPVRDGKFEFTVLSLECGLDTIGEDFLTQEAQGQYCLIGIRVSNIGDEPQTFTDFAQTAYDASEREFSPDSSAALYLEDSDLFFNEINPGNTVEGTLVFDIPVDGQLTVLELHDSPFSGGVEVALV